MPFLFLFFYAFTLLTFHYLIKAADKALLKFHKANMLVTLVRLLVYLVVIILCVAFRRENAVAIVAYVGFLYLVFTITEVIELSKYVRITGRSKKDSETASTNE